MSLLLDALKKSGPGAGKTETGSLSELSLEEIPGRPAAASTPSAAAAPGAIPSPRAASENLFAAKKAPAARKFQYNLGIVPTAIIIGLILGTTGSIYVWYEIQPPKAASYQPARGVTAPPPAALAAARPLPDLAMTAPTPTPAPKAEASAALGAPAVNTETRAHVVRRSRQAAADPSTPGIQIQHRSENDDIYTTVMAAYQAYQNGDLGTAWQRYREVLIKDARNRDALLGMAAIAQLQKQDEVAKQYYRQVLALDPRDPVAQAGMSSYSTADISSRESRLKMNLGQTPNSSALYFALGNLYSDQSRWSEAQEAYFNAFKIEPANAQFAFNLATSLDHLGQRRIAAQYYRQALQLDSKGNAGFDRAQTEKRLNQLTAP